MSWNPSIATIKSSEAVRKVVWSLCSRFVAISLEDDSVREIQILDAVTLKQLKTFTPPHPYTQSLTFSPERRLLTSLGHKALTSWDFQTGVQVCEILVEEERLENCYHCSITHSKCGTMFGVLYKGSKTSTISTYDVLSNTPICHHPVKEQVADTIWTYGEHLQFATFQPESLTILEVGFTSKYPPTVVESLVTPNNFDPSKDFLFLPILSRLAFILEMDLFVWDAQNSKLLLNFVDNQDLYNPTFSSDGHFFACGTTGLEIYLWKESPTGYTLHQRFISSDGSSCNPFLSPNGQSIITSSNSTLQLWHTTDLTTSSSSVSSQIPGSLGLVILGFSPDRSLAVAARSEGNIATVLDLKSGITQLTIETSMKIYGLGVTRDTVIIVGDGKVTAWNLPTGGFILNATANISDSVWITTLGHSTPLEWLWTTVLGHPEPLKIQCPSSASISPDLSYVAVMGTVVGGETGLAIYNMSTGAHLADTFLSAAHHVLWFTPDGHEVWCGQPREYEGWSIVEDSESNTTKLEGLDPTRGPSGGFPWESSQGHQVTGDGWVLSSSGKHLLWLPPHWRLNEVGRRWNGQFLAPLDVPEVVILEVPE